MASLLDEENRIDLARGVIHGDDQVERGMIARQPVVGRTVLKLHRAGQRRAHALFAMCRARGGHRHQPALLQHGLGPGVAQIKPENSALRASWKCLTVKSK